MQLKPLCEVFWQYDLVSADPEVNSVGHFYGQGTATVVGRVSGTATWSNYPRLGGGFARPNARGVIALESGGEVLFTLRGLSSLTDGTGLHTMMFETVDPDHLWLNAVLAVGEGTIDIERQALAMRYYECVAERLSEGP